MEPVNTVPEQSRVPWVTVITVSWAGLRRRFLRSLITMAGVILAIAFLSYMLTLQSITDSLVAVDTNDFLSEFAAQDSTARINAMEKNNELKSRLQDSGVDILAEGGPDMRMLLLLGLSLLTCTVGIINAMLMSVTERVREIGTLKCLGARDHFIIKTYFIESTLQGVFGALTGMIIGCTVALTVALFSYGSYVVRFFPILSTLAALAISLLSGSAISIVAAIAPAYIAAKKQPVDALRVEE